MSKKWPHGYDHTTGEGQKRLMRESRDMHISEEEFRSFKSITKIDGETGHDPIFDEDGNPTGKVKMYPTGRIVDLNEE